MIEFLWEAKKKKFTAKNANEIKWEIFIFQAERKSEKNAIIYITSIHLHYSAHLNGKLNFKKCHLLIFISLEKYTK